MNLADCVVQLPHLTDEETEAKRLAQGTWPKTQSHKISEPGLEPRYALSLSAYFFGKSWSFEVSMGKFFARQPSC